MNNKIECGADTSFPIWTREVRLEPPVNRVLPVARGRLDALWEAYGEEPEA